MRVLGAAESRWALPGIFVLASASSLGWRIVWATRQDIFTDDAYYYAVIARNLAATGKLTFDGVSGTNGFHPLLLLLEAGVAGLLPESLSPGSFYAAFAPEEAFALTQQFEMHYTPPKASWLNMVEIELSALSKQCLDRRIGAVETLTSAVLAWTEERNARRVTVHWQFTKEHARGKFERFYPVS